MNEQTQVVSPTNAPIITPAKPTKPAKAKKAAKPKTPAKKAPVKKAKKAKGDKVAKGPEVLREYAPGYVKDREHKTESGNASVHCGDDVAKKLLGKSLDDIYKLTAKTCDIPESELRKKYSKLNLGMQRMNLGNRLRGVLNAK